MLSALPADLVSQDEAVVDMIARVLQLEDERVFDGAIMLEAANHRDHVVRRRAALAMGRIADPAGTPILLELLNDPAPVVRQDAAFAIGLAGDRSAFDRLREIVLGAGPADRDGLLLEAMTAIAKLEGRATIDFYEEFLVRWVGRAVAGDEPPATVVQALWEAWRLGDAAPITLLLQYAEVRSDAARQAAVHSLSRLRAKEAASTFLRAVDDRSPLIRSWAVRALTASLADSAGLDPEGTARWVTPLLEDPDPHVRVNALRTLGTYRDPALTPLAANSLSDTDPGVRSTALSVLGQLGGRQAAEILAVATGEGSHAQRREALRGLAQVDRDQALVQCASWITETDSLSRAAGAEVLGLVGGDTAIVWLDDLTRDPNARVVAQAFEAVTRLDSARASELARPLAGHVDPVVRTLAVQRIGIAPQRSDVELLVRAYEMSLDDPISDARIAAVTALAEVAERGYSERVAVEDLFLSSFPQSRDYLVRRVAQERFPAAAAQWGPVTPIETGRNLDDYRAIARQLILPAEREATAPKLEIETERGRITVTLFAAEAPLTIDALLQLADRHYFDGGSWHRVVPNFVIQGGDPRGDGWGGPGFALRDENSRRRYGRGVVGMALGGPDTGGSQFFITHSPQPHLDGTYPVVGEVTEGMEVVDRIVQGDGIRTIRRR
ncbi:MAG: HEAT repeat domain-containing protein [Gemmatimonadota bacterium]|nr:MAG: HEAT repeat domain-containing protein [Gemmatimonadota bacterium]